MTAKPTIYRDYKIEFSASPLGRMAHVYAPSGRLLTGLGGGDTRVAALTKRAKAAIDKQIAKEEEKSAGAGS